MTTERRLTITEASEMLGVHRNTVRNWLVSGDFETAEKREGGRGEWTIGEAEVVQFRRRHGAGRKASAESLSEAVWAIHDLANRLADSEARAARAEAELEILRRDQPSMGS